MRILATLLLAIALILRAGPICAAPGDGTMTKSEPTAMHSCDDMPVDNAKHPIKQHGHTGKDAARVCHACAYPLMANSVLPKRVLARVVLCADAAEQLAGSALKPPIPPPRYVNGISIYYFNGVYL